MTPGSAGHPEYREGKPRLYRLVDGALQREYEDTVVAVDVGPDGTVWFVSLDELIRLDGTADDADPEPWALHRPMTAGWGSASGWTFLPGDAFRVAPDGSVWFALRADSGPPVSEEHCGGVARFDGTTWLGPFLPDRCVESIELATDGSVWLLAHAAESGDDLVDLSSSPRRPLRAAIAETGRTSVLDEALKEHACRGIPGCRVRVIGLGVPGVGDGVDLAARSLEDPGPTGDGDRRPSSCRNRRVLGHHRGCSRRSRSPVRVSPLSPVMV